MENNTLKYFFHDNDEHSVVLNGYWALNAENKLAYFFKGSTESPLEFKVALESTSLMPKKNSIKYRIGFGAKNSKKYKEYIWELFGTFKFSKSGYITMELEHLDDKFNKIKLILGKKIFTDTKAEIELNNENGHFTGIKLSLAKKLFKDASISFDSKISDKQWSSLVALSLKF